MAVPPTISGEWIVFDEVTGFNRDAGGIYCVPTPQEQLMRERIQQEQEAYYARRRQQLYIDLRSISCNDSRVREVHERAEKLLLENLTPKQKEDYGQYCAFEVRGSCGGWYRIEFSQAVNIRTERHRLCAGLPGDYPICDMMLAQKLMLETDEDGFLRIAKLHPLDAFPIRF